MTKSLVLSVLAFAWNVAPAQTVKDQFVGVWELVIAEQLDDAGTWSQATDLYGPSPIGIITYSAGGQMTGQIDRGDRPLFPTGTLAGTDRAGSIGAASVDQLRSAIRGYVAYFGTYSVDEGEQSVTHHRLGHLIPNNLGVSVKRLYSFQDDLLILSLPEGNLRFTWRRVSQ